MIKKCNDLDLKVERVDDELIYFYQLWTELVSRKTLDIYQYKVLNSFVALNELLDVVNKTINGLYSNDYNLQDCIAETKKVLSTDRPLINNEEVMIKGLKFLLEKSSLKRNDQFALKYKLEYCLEKLSAKYFNYVIDELWLSIDSSDRDGINKHTNILVSQCIFNGWSVEALYELTRIFKKEKSLEEKWDEFKSIISPGKRLVHDVLISVPYKTDSSDHRDSLINILSEIKLDVKSYSELVEEYEKDISYIGSMIKPEKYYIKTEVESPDIYSAAHCAIQEVAKQLNIASFYNVISVWDLRNMSVISINRVTKFSKVIKAEKLYETYDYIDASGRVFESVKNIYSDVNRKAIQEKLDGTFAYANISRASLFQEAKYMNLWVALESIARTDLNDNIISNIKNLIPSAVCLRYIYKIVRNFAEDCNRCRVDFNFSTFSIDINQESKQTLVAELIGAFNNTQTFAEIQEKCKVNALLLERANEIQKVLTDKEVLRTKLHNHHKNVEWQIQRLYRIRNEIAHSALQQNVSLTIYIEHLYDYLAVLISEISTCLINNNLNSLESVYSIICDNYDVFYLALKDSKSSSKIYDKVMLNGVIDIVY